MQSGFTGVTKIRRPKSGGRRCEGQQDYRTIRPRRPKQLPLIGQMSLEWWNPSRTMAPMVIKLTVAEIEALSEIVNKGRGRGGFQNLLLHCWYHLDEQTGELPLSELLLERINRYAFCYANSHWRKTLRRIFRRTLGANLDRGLTLK